MTPQGWLMIVEKACLDVSLFDFDRFGSGCFLKTSRKVVAAVGLFFAVCFLVHCLKITSVPLKSNGEKLVLLIFVLVYVGNICLAIVVAYFWVQQVGVEMLQPFDVLIIPAGIVTTAISMIGNAFWTRFSLSGWCVYIMGILLYSLLALDEWVHSRSSVFFCCVVALTGLHFAQKLLALLISADRDPRVRYAIQWNIGASREDIFGSTLYYWCLSRVYVVAVGKSVRVNNLAESLKPTPRFLCKSDFGVNPSRNFGLGIGMITFIRRYSLPFFASCITALLLAAVTIIDPYLLRGLSAAVAFRGFVAAALAQVALWFCREMLSLYFQSVTELCGCIAITYCLYGLLHSLVKFPLSAPQGRLTYLVQRDILLSVAGGPNRCLGLVYKTIVMCGYVGYIVSGPKAALPFIVAVIVVDTVVQVQLFKSQVRLKKVGRQVTGALVGTAKRTINAMGVIRVYNLFERSLLQVRKVAATEKEEFKKRFNVTTFSTELPDILFWFAAVAVVFAPVVLEGATVSAEVLVNVHFMTRLLVLYQSLVKPLRSIGMLVETFSELATFKSFENSGALSDTKTISPEQRFVLNASSSVFLVSEKFLVRTPNFTLDSDRKLILFGNNGSGKSSFCLALLGELEVLSGTVNISQSVAYASQTPWLFAGTLRENLFFDGPFDEENLLNSLDCLGLLTSLMLKGTSLSEIQVREKGSNFSGGQQQRLQIARCLVQRRLLSILDDPLSAVDEKTSGDCTRAIITKLHGVVWTTGQSWSRRGCSTDKLMFATIVSGSVSLLETTRSDWDLVVNETEVSGTLSNKTEVVQAPSSKKDTPAVVPGVHFLPKVTKVSVLLAIIGRKKIFVYIFVGLIVAALKTAALQFLLRAPTNKDGVIDMFWYFGCEFLIIVLYWSSTVYFTSSGCKNLSQAYVKIVENALYSRFDHGSEQARSYSKALSEHYLSSLGFSIMYQSYITFWEVIAVPIVILLKSPVVSGVMFLTAALILSSNLASSKLLRSLSKPYAEARAELLSGCIGVGKEGPSIRAHRVVVARLRPLVTQSVKLNLIRLFRKSVGLFLDVQVAVYALLCFSVSLMYVASSEAPMVNLPVILLLLAYGAGFFSGVRGVLGLIQESYKVAVSCQFFISASVLSACESEAGSHPLSPRAGHPPLELENVTVVYGRGSSSQQLALDHVSFVINPARPRVALIGKSGSGKSTLVKALLYFVEVSGDIRMFGNSIYSVDPTSWRNQIAFSPQDPVFTEGTIREQVDPFNRCTDRQLVHLAKRMSIYHIIGNIPGQLHASISEVKGHSHRKVLSNLRFLVAAMSSRVHLLDEPTSLLDDFDEKLFIAVLSELEAAAILAVTHSLQILRHFDEVIELSHGCVKPATREKAHLL